MPGLFRGRVIGVEHPGSIVSGSYQSEPVRQMMERGMRDLTGATDFAEGWKRFFSPGDIVGIKVNPVGQPHVISDASVVREIIRGLELAGVRSGEDQGCDCDRQDVHALPERTPERRGGATG